MPCAVNTELAVGAAGAKTVVDAYAQTAVDACRNGSVDYGLGTVAVVGEARPYTRGHAATLYVTSTGPLPSKEAQPRIPSSEIEGREEVDLRHGTAEHRHDDHRRTGDMVRVEA